MQTLQKQSVKELQVQLTIAVISQACKKVFPNLEFCISGPEKRESLNDNTPPNEGFSCSIPLSEIGFVIWNHRIRASISSSWNWSERDDDFPKFIKGGPNFIENLEEAIRKKVLEQMEMALEVVS
jgi:hypothetical protein